MKRLIGALLLLPALFFALPGCGLNDEPEDINIQDVFVGTGAEAALGDSVYVRFTARLNDASGQVFEQSQTPKGYILLGGNMTSGMALGILGMKVGGKRTVEAPSDYGYGPAGLGTAPNYTVPPNTSLYYDLELTGVKQRVGIQDPLTGTGTAARAGDRITVNYTLRLTPSGTPIQSNTTPFTTYLTIDSVILGWVRGIPGMKVGGRRILHIPSDMAYGENGVKDNTGKVIIAPNTDLYFEIELLDVVPSY